MYHKGLQRNTEFQKIVLVRVTRTRLIKDRAYCVLTKLLT